MKLAQSQMSQKKAVKSLIALEEQFTSFKETVNAERLTILALEELLVKIKFVHPDIKDLIALASNNLAQDVGGLDFLKRKSVEQAEIQKNITIQLANKEYEDNLRKVRKILIQDVFYKIHKLKTTHSKSSPVPISKRIDRMRLINRLSTKHVMPVVHSKASSAELEFDLNIIKVIYTNLEKQ